MNTIITRGLGPKNQLITQGYGGTLFVVITPPEPTVSLGAGGGRVILPKRDEIITRKIKVPDIKDKITVDVLLIQYSEDLSVKAIMDEFKDKYTDIKVYFEKDVEFDDGIKD